MEGAAAGEVGKHVVRQSAARALGRIGDAQGVPALIRALEADGEVVDSV